MKKINQIEIGGHKFYFEEEACTILESYIARIKELYRDNGEDLKVTDVESRIGEMCLKQVCENGIVTAPLINDIISKIGIQIDNTQENSATTEEEANTEAPQKNDAECDEAWYRAMQLGSKIFRNPHRGYVGGVLAGLATYFGISIALLRILTVIFYIVEPTGIVLIIYIALWIILPKATSIIDYTRMHRVSTKDSREKTKDAWKNNYEKVTHELALPPASGCLPTLVKILIFAPIILFSIPFGILLIAIIVMPFAFFYLFFTSGIVGVISMPVVTLAISAIIVAAIILFALVYWLLKASNVCKPMNKRSKIILTILLIVSLLCAGVAAHHTALLYGGYKNIVQIFTQNINGLSGNLFSKYFIGSATSKYGSFYSAHPVKSDNNKLFASIWDTQAQQSDIPFIIETIHNDRGEYNIYFYHHKGRAEDIERKIVNKEYDVRYTINTDKLHGYTYFIWDEAHNTIYADEVYEIPQTTRSSTFEKRSDVIKIEHIEFDGAFNYGNAGEKGLVPFSIFFYADQRTPSLLVGGSADSYGIELPPASTYKHIKGFQIMQPATTINSNGSKDTVQVSSNINIDEDKMQKALDGVEPISKKAEEIIKDAGNIVSITVTEE